MPEITRFLPELPDLGVEWDSLLIPGVPLRAVGAHSAAKDQDFPAHYHHGLELVIHRAGHSACAVQSASGETVQVIDTFPGCVILMPAGVVHRDRALGAYQHHYLLFDPLTEAHGLSPALPGLAALLEHLGRVQSVTVYRDSPERRLERIVADLVGEWHGGARGRERMVGHLLEELAIVLERLSVLRSLSDTEQVVLRIERLLEERFSSNPSIRGLAEEVGVGYSSLRDHFARLRGYSPKAYLKQVRVRRALELIRSSSLTLEEVASVTGFDSASHLWRDVKAATGQTPGDFRLGRHPLPR